MKKLLILLMAFIASNTYSQEFNIELNLKQIIYGNDSIEFEDFKKVKISFNDCSEIVELCQFQKNTIGIQFEILESKLADTSQYISAYVIYVKEKKKPWEILSQSSHSKININEENPLNKLREQKDLPPALLKYALSTTNSISIDNPVRFVMKYDIVYKLIE